MDPLENPLAELVDDAGGKDRFYVRVDGEVYTTITRGAAGM